MLDEMPEPYRSLCIGKPAGMIFQRESVTKVIDEIKPLLEMHWREIAHYQDIELNPDWEFYLSVPSVRVYTARMDGELIGYGVFFIGPNRHYKQSVQAVQDILFVHPSHRGGRTGYKLLAFCDSEAKAEGAQAIYHHVKAVHDFGPLLKRLGYETVDLIYARRLDR